MNKTTERKIYIYIYMQEVINRFGLLKEIIKEMGRMVYIDDKYVKEHSQANGSRKVILQEGREWREKEEKIKSGGGKKKKKKKMKEKDDLYIIVWQAAGAFNLKTKTHMNI